MPTFLITGGAGFIGSNLAIRLKRDHENARVIALDNLRRLGSALNLDRLNAHGVEFVHGDIRQPADLDVSGHIDCLIECSAEPSVQAGYSGSPEYVVSTNLVGVLHCLELARRRGADFILLSTSRVYPIHLINKLAVAETPTRYELLDRQDVPGVSSAGLTEAFPLEGTRSLYGATKLAGELILSEYLEMYGLRGVINRCGVIAGPWQMGKADQGVVALWVARHVFGGALQYIGYGGSGKQVRDILHIEDLYRLLDVQIRRVGELNGKIFNVGGGRAGSVSLKELTALCEGTTGTRLDIQPINPTHPADVRVYVSDCRKVFDCTGWRASIGPPEIVVEMTKWISDNRRQLEPILSR